MANTGERKTSSMLSLDTIDTILTPSDLAEHVKEELQEAGGDPGIVVEYTMGEMILTSKGHTHGLSISLNSYGLWVIHEQISHENDGIFAQTGHSYKTENTVTVMRAIARWLMDVMETRQVVPVKYRFGIFLPKTARPEDTEDVNPFL